MIVGYRRGSTREQERQNERTEVSCFDVAMSDEKSHTSLDNSAAVNIPDLHQCDFELLIAKLVQAHFPGTREWLFDEVRSWLRVGTQRLFWLEGAAGTGKSVVSAKLLGTQGVKEHIVAWHFCRHDNAAGSSVRVIIESWAAMLCKHVEGFEVSEGVKNRAFAASNAQEMFELLIAAPLAKVRVSKGGSVVFLLDALDELPRESMALVLGTDCECVSELAFICEADCDGSCQVCCVFYSLDQ